ncbi:MAG TPA: prephenate dehydratase [Thermoleophilaceae bacterium]|nr:prephenate dehydratase [Thermoleophilaceae bacterium]
MAITVAYLGPAGTYTHEAMRASAVEEISPQPRSTVYETVMAVQEGTADRAVVPIENSLEGGVAATLDALAGEADRVRIAAEVVHPIHHCLVAAEDLPLGRITRVLSHPQAVAQCARYLRERLPSAERVATTSTAEAVRTVREQGGPWAALGSRLSAELYDGRVLAEGVEDEPDNVTRFVWLAPEGAAAAGVDGPAKTSIVFWGFNDASPGALVSVLSELSDRSINLTKIESRPRSGGLGHYMFFADLEGHEHERNITTALTALAERVETLRVLGSYPVAGG